MQKLHVQHPRCQQRLFTTLADNTSDQTPMELSVRGTLPVELQGVLYRNGPGLFRRGAELKGSLLDGDGLVQRLALSHGKAFYSRRFVRTKKYRADEAAQQFLTPTWTTKAQKPLANVGGRVLSQAGITVNMINGSLYALDEVAPGYELDPLTLDTLGEAQFGLPDNDQSIKAHTRYLPDRREWVLASTRMGRQGMTLDFVRHRPNGQRVKTPSVSSPRMVYLHDFGATEQHAVVILQPAFVRPLRFLLGRTTFAESLEWRPSEGNIILLIDFDTGAAKYFEAPASWVWHIGNVYDTGDSVVVDFVGYDDPWHFLGKDAQLAAIMRGKAGRCGAAGRLRRYTMNKNTGRLTHTIIAEGAYEFPTIDQRLSGAAHQYLYSTHGNLSGGILHNRIAATNVHTATVDAFDFGAHVNVLEPVFAENPGKAPGQGWLIVQFTDMKQGTSGFVVLDAQNVKAGPVATIELADTIPISFHGQWIPG